MNTATENPEARPPSLAIIGLNYAPEPVGIGPYTASMAESLAARGWRVEVVSGAPYYPQWRRYSGFSGLWRRSAEHGVTVTRCAHYVPTRPTGIRRIAHLASFAVTAVPPALRVAGRSPDVVLCVVPALLSVPVAWMAARFCGAKLWIHVQDFEVEAAFATGLMDGGGLTGHLARRFENGLLGLADRVSSISPRMVAQLRLKGVLADRALEMRNWADERFARSEGSGEAFRREWNLGERHVALYSGSIANKQGIEILVEAARLLAGRKDIAIIICGEGPNRTRLAKLAEGLGNVQLRDLQPVARMGELLALADLHLLPQIADAADLVLPSKLTNMLASGRPVVATAAPGSGLAAEVAGCGVVTPPGDAAALAEAVMALIDNPARRAALGRAAQQRAEERWSKKQIIKQLDSELRRLVGSQPAPSP